MMEAMRQADEPSQGESVKKGAESMCDVIGGGICKGATIRSEDRGSSRFAPKYVVKNGGLGPIRDWFEDSALETETAG